MIAPATGTQHSRSASVSCFVREQKEQSKPLMTRVRNIVSDIKSMFTLCSEKRSPSVNASPQNSSLKKDLHNESKISTAATDTGTKKLVQKKTAFAANDINNIHKSQILLAGQVRRPKEPESAAELTSARPQAMGEVSPVHVAEEDAQDHGSPGGSVHLSQMSSSQAERGLTPHEHDDLKANAEDIISGLQGRKESDETLSVESHESIYGNALYNKSILRVDGETCSENMLHDVLLDMQELHKMEKWLEQEELGFLPEIKLGERENCINKKDILANKIMMALQKKIDDIEVYSRRKMNIKHVMEYVKLAAGKSEEDTLDILENILIDFLLDYRIPKSRAKDINKTIVNTTAIYLPE